VTVIAFPKECAILYVRHETNTLDTELGFSLFWPKLNHFFRVRPEALILSVFLLFVEIPGFASHRGCSQLGSRVSCAFAAGSVIDVASYGIEKCSPTLFTKLSFRLDTDFSLSLRPVFLIGDGSSAVRMPVSFDLCIPRVTHSKVQERNIEYIE